MGARQFRQRSYVQEAAQRVVYHLELEREGRGWFCGERGAPATQFNPCSGTRYHGINQLLLEMSAPAGSNDPRWLTLRQIEESGGMQLARGARAGLAIYAMPIAGSELRPAWSGDDGRGEAPNQEAYVLKGCSVFNGADIIGLPPMAAPPRIRERGDEYFRQLIDAIWRELGADEECGAAGDVIPFAPDEHFADMRGYACASLLRIAVWAADRLQPLPRSRGSAPVAASVFIAAAWLSGLAGCDGPVAAGGNADFAAWADCLRRDPLEAFRAAGAAENIMALLCQRSPSLARLKADEDDFIRAHALAGGMPPELPSGSDAAHARAALRGALLMEASWLTVPELAQCLSAHFGCNEVLPRTDAAIHQAFQDWARQAIASGACDDAKLTGRQLLSIFLERQETVVLGMLESDDVLRRQMRAASAVDMASPSRRLAAAGAERERRISAQPLRDAKGSWLGVRHEDLIALGLTERIVDVDSRMSPDMVYLACDDGRPDSDARRLLDAAETAGWVVDLQPCIEREDAQVSGYAGYFAPLVGYAPKVGDRLKLVEGLACIREQSAGGGWVVSLASGKRRVLSHARFCDFIESVIDGDYIVA